MYEIDKKNLTFVALQKPYILGLEPTKVLGLNVINTLNFLHDHTLYFIIQILFNAYLLIYIKRPFTFLCKKAVEDPRYLW